MNELSGRISLVIGILCLLVGASTVPRWWCGRFSDGWYDGHPAAVRPLARAVAARAQAGISAADFSTGSARFDGEWAFGSYAMTLIGLAQTLRADPAQRAELEPALRAAVGHAQGPELVAFGEAAWGDNPFGSLDGDHGHAYLGYLNLALGVVRSVVPEGDHVALHDRLSTALARRLAEAPGSRIETYPNEMYPVDVAMVAASLTLHARLSGADHRAVLERWREHFDQEHRDPETGMLRQALDPTTGEVRDGPRASGTTLAAFALGFSHPTLARQLFAATDRACFASVLGFGWMREYPRGHAGKGDIDSGPVVLGAGVSATGFAIGAARASRQRDRFDALARTLVLFGIPMEQGARFLSGGPIGDAIVLAMLTAGGTAR